jgi:hypothetical protein
MADEAFDAAKDKIDKSYDNDNNGEVRNPAPRDLP